MPALAFDTDGRDWPNRQYSRFVRAGGLTWHVQDTGTEAGKPCLVLLHGTGASTHSWAGLLPELAPRFQVFAMDLPGHAFTSRPPYGSSSLEEMAAGLGALVKATGITPHGYVGHSAGAAVALRAILNKDVAPAPVIGINAALKPFGGAAGAVFPALARALFLNPVTSFIFARRAMDGKAVEKVLAGTGSTLPPAQISLYKRLFQNAWHVDATLGMMARWTLPQLWKDLTRLVSPLHLVSGGNDRTVPPSDAMLIKTRVRHATITRLEGLGHLAHEEDPSQVAGLITQMLGRHAPVREAAA